jgi:diguanylate cyclase (GGDEF)-like protein/PAS domain S-box-containing protein
MVRNEAGVITEVDDSISSLLGWRPEQLIGTPSTALIHPNDQTSAISAWFAMTSRPQSTRKWRGRYRTVEGKWCWIETINTNQLDDPDHPGVLTLMQPANADYVSVEEELRAREELLTRLSDALPVGIFQVDADHRVLSSNARLHQILGTPPSGDLAAQFDVVIESDWARFVAAIEAVLRGEDVDHLELRFRVVVPHPEFAATRVCQVSLRPLTDGTHVVTGAVGSLSDVTESVELRRELELRASRDSLTGCLNRGATFELLDRAMRAAANSKTGVGAIYIDLDGFKGINDHYGHATGDQALLAASDKIRSALRADDVVGRLGGDEFLVVCPGLSSIDEGLAFADRIGRALCGRLQMAGNHITLAASVGVAWSSGSDESPDALVARADSAMYQSKSAGNGSAALAANDGAA